MIIYMCVHACMYVCIEPQLKRARGERVSEYGIYIYIYYTYIYDIIKIKNRTLEKKQKG